MKLITNFSIIIFILSCANLDPMKQQREETNRRLRQHDSLFRAQNKPRIEPIVPGVSITYDANEKSHNYSTNKGFGAELELSNGGSVFLNDWENGLKDFVLSFPKNKREIVLNALSFSYATYDQVEQRTIVNSRTVLDDYVSLSGFVKNKKPSFRLVIHFITYADFYIENLLIVIDGKEFKEKTKFETAGDNSRIKKFELTTKIRNLAKKIIKSKKTFIRVSGKKSVLGRSMLKYSDQPDQSISFELTKEMKRQMKSVFGLLDVLK